MGKPDLFAKRTFADDTPAVTNGAALWSEAPEIGFDGVQSDGILVIRNAAHLKCLEAPWKLVGEGDDEILAEIKMQGDHVDRANVARILLRRQARELQRIEQVKKDEPPWLGTQTVWVVSAYLPKWAMKQFRPIPLDRGCYRFATELFQGLWIAANELPLHDELIPFLITRTGKPLLEFLKWVVERKSWHWIEDLLRSLRMLPQEAYDFIKQRYPYLDPESKANVDSWIFALVDDSPELKERIMMPAINEAKAAHEAALRDGREAVLRVLELRRIPVRSEHRARVEACNDRALLRRWLDQAVVAPSADAALATD